MANAINIKVGTQFTFADHATDFVGGAAKTSLEQTSTNVQLDTTSLADAAGRESAKIDLTAIRDEWYSFIATMEFAATPVTGERVDFYWAPSPDSVAANGNPMSIDGVDAAAPSGVGTLAELQAACDFIGSAIITNDATASVQTAVISSGFVPSERFGILLVVNESGAAFHSDAVETHVSMQGYLREVQ